MAGAGAYIISGASSVPLTEFIGKATNNYAEYTAVLLGLDHIVNNLHLSHNDTVKIYGDSQLVIKQLKGEWRVKSSNLRNLYTKSMELIKQLKEKKITTTFHYIPREKNSIADKLANEAIDTR